MPAVQKLYDQYRTDPDVAFLIISRLDSPAAVRRYSRLHHYDLPFYTMDDDDIPPSMQLNQIKKIDSMIAADVARNPIGSVNVGIVSGKQLIWTKLRRRRHGEEDPGGRRYGVPHWIDHQDVHCANARAQLRFSPKANHSKRWFGRYITCLTVILSLLSVLNSIRVPLRRSACLPFR